MQDKIKEMRRIAREWRKSHQLKSENAWDSHDYAHYVSGYPPTEKGEIQQRGWEMAILGIGVDCKLDYFPPSDDEIEGWLAGYDFRQTNPEIAGFVEFCLMNI